MILLDTSVLIGALTGTRPAAPALGNVLSTGEVLTLSAIVLFEWLRGPRLASEIAAQEALFPSESALAFGAAEARLGASIYRAIQRPRGREADIAIAATAIRHNAQLWTLNPKDFADIPGLSLHRPR